MSRCCGRVNGFLIDAIMFEVQPIKLIPTWRRGWVSSEPRLERRLNLLAVEETVERGSAEPEIFLAVKHIVVKR